ncbi:MAG TPA: hypothetical protein VMS17_29225 [Gemmataceae bacterium]|nr:hypothetical protein [Gemmataceae bacterium]
MNAQPPGLRPPGPQPISPAPFSPYLNLLRNGNPAYLNYYGLVRPQVDLQNQLYGVQLGVATNAAAIGGVDPLTGLPVSGHPTAFLNTSHYFLNRGGQGYGGQGTSVMGPAAGAVRAAATQSSATPR